MSGRFDHWSMNDTPRALYLANKELSIISQGCDCCSGEHVIRHASTAEAMLREIAQDYRALADQLDAYVTAQQGKPLEQWDNFPAT